MLVALRQGRTFQTAILNRWTGCRFRLNTPDLARGSAWPARRPGRPRRCVSRPWACATSSAAQRGARQGMKRAAAPAGQRYAMGLRDRHRSGQPGGFPLIQQGWGVCGLWMSSKVARRALRPTAPRLADILDGVVESVARPDRPGRCLAGSRRAAPRRRLDLGLDAITVIPTVIARNKLSNTLGLHPYGEWASAYTQVDAAGRRIGALLLADTGGWLHQTMPVASLERYRVAASATLRGWPTRIQVDSTVRWKATATSRLGADCDCKSSRIPPYPPRRARYGASPCRRAWRRRHRASPGP